MRAAPGPAFSAPQEIAQMSRRIEATSALVNRCPNSPNGMKSPLTYGHLQFLLAEPRRFVQAVRLAAGGAGRRGQRST